MQRTLPEPSSHRMTQHSPVTTRLTIILQYCGKAQKPKSSCSINLKGAKSSQWCHRSGVLFYSKLTPSAIRRDSNNAIVIFRIAGVQTVQKQSHNITNTKIQEFSIDSQIYNSSVIFLDWTGLDLGLNPPHQPTKSWSSRSSIKLRSKYIL